MYPTITLLPIQHQSGVYQGERRKEESARFNHSNQRGLEDSGNIDVQGSLGEVAAAVAFKLPFSYSINRWSQPDCIINGKPVDVKTSTEARFLNVSPRHLHNDWYYLLVRLDDEFNFSFIGYMKGSQIAKYPLVDNKRKSPYYAIPACDLKPVPPFSNN